MSQHMDFEETSRNQQVPPYDHYETAYSAQPLGSTYGQKIPPLRASKQASPGQRLALAIISLVLFVGALATIFSSSSSLNNWLGIIALVVVGATFAIINYFFSR